MNTPSHRHIIGIGDEVAAFVWETFKIVVISLAIIIPIRYYLVQPFFVKGASMEPNFVDKDYVLVDKLRYRFVRPHRGDVVVFRFPQDPEEFFIKRIIGLPGETVVVRSNEVTIFNGEYPQGLTLDEDTYLAAGQETLPDSRVRLDDNEFFVMGDNRLHSSDSRRWGAVNESLIAGRAFVRLWPLTDIVSIPRIEYAP